MTEPIRIPIELDLTIVNKQLAEFAERVEPSTEAYRRIMATALSEPKATSTLPLESLQLLLDMVRGVKPFDLVSAIKAALAIAEYVTTLFDTKTMAATPDFTLEAALAQVVEQHKQPHAASISGSVLFFILQEAMKWIVEQMAK